MAKGENRERLIEEGVRLLSEGGFRATGVQEITDACGVPKGSFYNYFGSKTEFGVAVLEAYGQASAERVDAVLGDRGQAPLARLRRLFESWGAGMADCGFRGGCLAGNLTQEMADRDDLFRGVLERLHRGFEDRVAAVLREAREAGELRSGRDPDALAGFLVNAWHGALLRMKSAGDDRPLRNFLDEVFDGVLSRRAGG